MQNQGTFFDLVLEEDPDLVDVALEEDLTPLEDLPQLYPIAMTRSFFDQSFLSSLALVLLR